MNFKKWAKSIQTLGYNGARTVLIKYQKRISHAFDITEPLIKQTYWNDFEDTTYRKGKWVIVVIDCKQ